MSLPNRLLLCAAVLALPALAQTLDSEQSAFLTLINNYRAQNGVGPLQVSVALQNSSQWMSSDMASKNYFSHTDSLGRTPDVRIQAFGYPYYPWGENIAAGYSDAQSTFTLWVNACDPDSTGACTYAHRLNMLNGSFKVMGIGRAYNAGAAYRWYWTTDFGGVVDQLLGSPPPAPAIGSFTASPAAITAGQPVTLSWSVSGSGVTLTLDNGIGDVSSLTSFSVSPSATTTYNLTAANAGGAVSASVTVTVNAPPPPTFTPIRVNSGGPAYTDPQGNVWSADTGAGASYTWFANGVAANTPTPLLYQTCRYGAAFQYQFAVPNGSYSVKLKFAEISMTGPGQRLFNVALNGSAVLANFDIFAAAGGAWVALDESFPVTVTGGQIQIQFTSGSANYPMVNAIEILQGAGSGGAATYRVHAGGGALTDTSGNSWAADNSFNGGTPWSTSQTVGNTATPALYQTCRYGASFSYQFPVSNGNYSVTLKFAEISRTAVGQRVFNVAINGVPVLSDFDIVARAGGPLRALDEVFPVTVSGGQITIQFTAGPADLPLINAISIAPGAAAVRVHAGGGALTDASGNSWSADASYIGGSPWSTTQNVGGTANPALYQTCRYGNGFSYQFNLPNGSYTVTLKFAEISRTAVGQRIFSVAIDGAAVLSNFDILAAAGSALTAVDKSFPVTVTNGQVTVQFLTGPADLPMVNAIQIQ